MLLLLIAEFCFALSTVFGKLATSGSSITGIEVSFFRFLIGSVVMTVMMLYNEESFRPQNIKYVVFRAIANTFAVMLFFTGIQYTTVTNANMLNLTYPAFVFMLAPFINGEKSNHKHIKYLVCAIAGVYLIVVPDFSSVNPGDLASLMSGVVAGFAICFLREARKYDSASIIMFYLMVNGLVLNTVLMIPVFVRPEPSQLILMILSGGVAVIGQGFLTVGYRHVEAARGAVVSGSRILFAGAMGIAVFSDPLTAGIASGGILILMSLFGISGIFDSINRT